MLLAGILCKSDWIPDKTFGNDPDASGQQPPSEGLGVGFGMTKETHIYCQSLQSGFFMTKISNVELGSQY